MIFQISVPLPSIPGVHLSVSSSKGSTPYWGYSPGSRHCVIKKWKHTFMTSTHGERRKAVLNSEEERLCINIHEKCWHRNIWMWLLLYKCMPFPALNISSWIYSPLNPLADRDNPTIWDISERGTLFKIERYWWKGQSPDLLVNRSVPKENWWVGQSTYWTMELLVNRS